MYSVVFMAAFAAAPMTPDGLIRHRAGANCAGGQAASASASCNGGQAAGVVVLQAAANCNGETARRFAPFRNMVARHDERVSSRVESRASARHSGESTAYYAASARYVDTPMQQSAAPPVAAAPLAVVPPVVVQQAPAPILVFKAAPPPTPVVIRQRVVVRPTQFVTLSNCANGYCRRR